MSRPTVMKTLNTTNNKNMGKKKIVEQIVM